MGEEGLSSSHESGYWTLMAAGKLIAHTAPPGDKALSLPLRCVGVRSAGHYSQMIFSTLLIPSHQALAHSKFFIFS